MADNQAGYSVGGYRNAPGVSATPAGAAPPQPPGLSVASGSMVVNTDDLQKAASGFDDLGGQVSSLYQNLAQTLDGNDSGGAPWGSDSLGQGFGGQYVPASQMALQAVQGLAQLLGGIGGALGEAAGTFQGAEEHNAQIVSGLA
jgi:uncharacterized protein YukE